MKALSQVIGKMNYLALSSMCLIVFASLQLAVVYGIHRENVSYIWVANSNNDNKFRLH